MLTTAVCVVGFFICVVLLSLISKTLRACTPGYSALPTRDKYTVNARDNISTGVYGSVDTTEDPLAGAPPRISSFSVL